MKPQKKLIETLTTTHTNPKQAYLQAIEELVDPFHKNYIKRVANHFNITIEE